MVVDTAERLVASVTYSRPSDTHQWHLQAHHQRPTVVHEGLIAREKVDPGKKRGLRLFLVLGENKTHFLPPAELEFLRYSDASGNCEVSLCDILALRESLYDAMEMTLFVPFIKVAQQADSVYLMGVWTERAVEVL